MARYETVMTLFRQGLSQREIARRCNLNRITVRRFIRAAEFPERSPRYYPSTLDSYCEHLKMRWRQGGHNCVQLYRELRCLGFTGRPRTLRDWINKQQKFMRLRKPPSQRREPRRGTSHGCYSNNPIRHVPTSMSLSSDHRKLRNAPIYRGSSSASFVRKIRLRGRLGGQPPLPAHLPTLPTIFNATKTPS